MRASSSPSSAPPTCAGSACWRAGRRCWRSATRSARPVAHRSPLRWSHPGPSHPTRSGMQIDGISALVTGGASGLGLATARRLVDKGAGRVVLLDLPTSPGEQAAADLGKAARFVPGDVTDEAGVQAALDAAAEEGPVRAVVHCA